MISLTVIVPVLDEAVALARLLPRLDTGVQEVLVVDGGSRDASRQIAAAQPGVRVLSSPPPLAVQMNAGAAAATGKALLFLHADTLPPAGFAAAISTALADERVVGGAFDLDIDDARLVARLVAWGASLRSRLTRSPYGDQGIFVRAAEFHRLGGFAVMPFMEDLEFCHRLKQRGRIRFLRPPMQVSPRRWRAHGYARTTWRNAVLAGCFYLGADPGRFATWRRPVRDDSETSD